MNVGVNDNITALYQKLQTPQINSQAISQNSCAAATESSDKNEKIKKAGIGVCAALGLASSLLLLSKVSKPASALKVPVKTLAEKLKNSYILKANYKTPQIVTMGAGSILGGLLGGAIFDKKENFNAKIRESVVQILNIATPIAFVEALSTLGKKVSAKSMPGWADSGKFLKKAASKLPQTLGATVGLVGGMFLGNRISNKLNEKVFHKKDNRPMKWKDFSAHVDDIAVAATFVADENNPITKTISRLIPLALVVPGIEVGNKKEKGCID